MDRAPLTVVVLTLNEARNIESCLRSVAGWAEEIHVVDSGSTDETVQLARKYTEHVHHHRYVDHASQLRWVVETVALKTEWILFLDADLRLTDAARAEISRALARDDPKTDGYYVEHQMLFRGRRVRGLKSRSLQLMRYRNATIGRSELVDALVVFRGRTGYIASPIVEDNENERDIDFWIDKHQRYASRQALEEVLLIGDRIRLAGQGSLLGDHDARMIWLRRRWYSLPLFVRPAIYFAYRYFVRLGVLDGRDGFVFHFMQAWWYRLLVDVKVDDHLRNVRTGRTTYDELHRRWAGVREANDEAGDGEARSGAGPAGLRSRDTQRQVRTA
jgi:glycosyltransferase involved in cell wall biosynthesis